MSETPESFLDRLADGLTPVAPMRLWPMWAGRGAGLVLAALFIIICYGPRPEMAALMHGVWPAKLIVMAKPLLFVVMGLSALWGASGLMRPEGRLRVGSLLPVAVLLVVVIMAFIAQFISDGPAKVAASLNGGGQTCFMTIMIGGLIGFMLMWRLWLRQAATSHPVALGALSGLATASFMAAAYAIHCNMDAPVYILAIYGLAVATFTAIAAVLGGKMLTW